ncbi:MAG: HYR domain-containing protein [Acidobacteria bacterium]|nr:HYR domain-containing protein [Acidobacteriota bacterium]
MERQSVDALPVTISWDLPTVAGIPVDKSSCSPASGSAFPIGTSTVTCTPDQTTLASSCSFSITITPPDPKLRFTRFMAFGDSITEGFIRPGLLPPGVTPHEIVALLRAARGRPIPEISNAVQPLNAYPVQLQNLLTAAYATQLITVANKGVSGEETAQGVSRITSSLLSVQPELLLLLEGFNDISAAFVNRPAGDTTPISIATIAANLRSMVLNAQGHGVEVLLATLTPVTELFEDDVPGTRATILALNTEIRSMATALGLGGVVDLYAALDGVPGVIGADGFHPTVTGYRRMAELFFAEIVSRYDITPRAPALTAP